MRTAEARWLESQARWRVDVQQDGIRKSFYSSKPGRKGKLEAERKADIWLDDNTPGGGQRVSVMLDQWMDGLKASTSKSHWHQYQNYINRWIIPAIGKKRIESITENDLQKIINTAYRDGDLAAKTLKNLRAALCNFMKFCRAERATQLRPENLTIPNGARKSNKKILQPADLRQLFEFDETLHYGKPIKDIYIHAYRFQVLTGLRPGELFGLRWDDIRGDLVSVRRSLNEFGEITRGKNDNALRTFELPAQAVAELQAQKTMLADLKLISPFIFCDAEAQPIDQRRYRVAWKRYCQHNNFADVTTPYELRHTFVSVADEIPTGLKKMVVGHSQSMDTEGIYGHQKQGDMSRAARYIEDAFESALAR